MQKTVLITGASSGIGNATANHLLGTGYRVFGTRRRSAPEQADGIDWVSLDVCSDESVTRGLDQVLTTAGKLDALICNAGYGEFGSLEECSIERARSQFETNYFGTIRTLRAAIPHMRERGDGRILIVGSLAGRAPIPFQSHYSASKAALDAMTLSLRNELHGTGVHVSLIEPGDINTPFNAAMHWEEDGTGENSVYDARARRCEAVIRKSLPDAPPPEEVARCIARALDARHPRVRYTVGAESFLVPLARRLLPDALSLRIIRDHFDI